MQSTEADELLKSRLQAISAAAYDGRETAKGFVEGAIEWHELAEELRIDVKAAAARQAELKTLLEEAQEATAVMSGLERSWETASHSLQRGWEAAVSRADLEIQNTPRQSSPIASTSVPCRTPALPPFSPLPRLAPPPEFRVERIAFDRLSIIPAPEVPPSRSSTP